MKNAFFIALCLLLFCYCKEPTDNCIQNCNWGFICDNNTGECVCPQGSILHNNSCETIQENWYLPVAANANCLCFSDITAIYQDSTAILYEDSIGIMPVLTFKDKTGSGQGFSFGNISLKANPTNPQEWTYLAKFVSGFDSFLPCKLNEQRVDAHLYININDDTIHIKVDFVPYIPNDWFHLEEYPVLDSCELMFVK